MRCFLNCGFGSPLGSDLALIAGLGFSGVRQDVLHVVDAPILAAELRAANLGAILVLAPAIWRSPAAVRAVVAGVRAVGLLDVAFEVGNELDAGPGATDPRAYALAFSEAHRAALQADPGAHLMTAGITSTHAAGLAWLRQVLGSGLISEYATIAVHTYRSGEPSRPHAGFTSRSAEWAEVDRIAAGRRIACTEVGWTNARTSWWPCARPLGEGQVAQYLREEIEIARQAGTECCVVYQLNDGPGRDPLDRMGIRRHDGTLKPAAYVAMESGR